MHYGNYAFSSNGQPTIVAKNGMTLLEAYDKTSLSQLDIEALKRAYSLCKAYFYFKFKKKDLILFKFCVKATLIPAGSEIIPHGDDNYQTLDLGFVFPYFKTNFTQLTVSSNGFVHFSSVYSTCCKITRPTLS